MRVRLMQLVDFWVGVPLCALLSLVDAVLRLVARREPPAPKKMLFIELSEMGSAILAHSALVRATAMAGAPPHFLIFRRNRESCEVLQLLPREHILVIDDGSFVEFAVSALRTLLTIRRMGFDTVLDLELFSRFTALFTRLTGAANRVGFHRHTGEGLFRGTFLTHRVNYNPHQHMALNFLALVNALEAPRDEIPMLKQDVRRHLVELPRYVAEADTERAVRRLLTAANPRIAPESPLLLLNPDPGEQLPIRGWPEERFAQVALELLELYPDAFLVVIGLARSRPFAARLIAVAGAARCADLTGQTRDLNEVLALCAMAKVLITNDSGPAHLAALTPLRSVVLFGPETPALYGPLGGRATSLFAGYACSPCLAAANHRHTWCRDSKCLQAIAVAEVTAAARAALEQAGLDPRPSR